MQEVRIGIIGVGVMGSYHAQALLGGRVRRCRLAAVCDLVPERLSPYEKSARTFTDSRELIRSGAVDAVLISTPHYGHTTIGIDALRQGLHVLVEKPVSVHKADCERLFAAHRNRKQVFAAMFNQRTDPTYRRLKHLIDTGELGALVRVNWIITNWFRTDFYYASGSWRATWAGEGGGVLMNQSPHQLDLLTWLCGMPKTVRAFCHLGKHHPIEVEDEVTAYLEYEGGATGVFITSTGEAPGTNRLEIVGDRGKVVCEAGRVHFTRNEVSVAECRRTARNGYSAPEVWECTLPVSGSGGQHVEVAQNFVDAILDGAALIAPAEEGIRSVELSNAMLYSSLRGESVKLPLSGAKFETCLKGLIAGAQRKKTKSQK